jgi:hypothetical protein
MKGVLNKYNIIKQTIMNFNAHLMNFHKILTAKAENQKTHNKNNMLIKFQI